MTQGGVNVAVAGTLVLISLMVEAADAQSLGALARKAGARPRPAAGRVLTNADLPPVESSPVAAADPAPQGQDSNATASTQNGLPAGGDPTTAAEATTEPVKPREKRTEAYWRAQAHDLRNRLARIESDASGLAARLRALDAGPATPAALQERGLVETALNRARTDERYLRDQMTQFEARAQDEHVPAAWLR